MVHLRRALARSFHLRGDLAKGEAFQVAQLDHLAILGAQGLEGAEETLLFVGRGGVGRR